MSTLNRSIAPELIIPKEIAIPAYKTAQLDNGAVVYLVPGLKQEALKIELIFKAGRMFETQRQVSQITATMLKEGSVKYPALKFAELIDFYGASFNASGSYDYATVGIRCLNKHLPSVLALAEDALKNPAFNSKDLEAVISTKQQNLLVNLEKNEYLADKQFNENLYGSNHPFGYLTTVEDYDKITPELLKAFHKTHYASNNMFLMVSGNIDDQVVPTLNKYFGGEDWASSEAVKGQSVTMAATPKSKIITPVDDSVQSSIRIGKAIINKTHPDYFKLSILNTVFGGYFGSRLMSNIREDKGYTYGIYSSLSSIDETGYLQITTDVGKDVCEAAVKEIYIELNRLINEPIPADELELVKNYLIGRMLSGIDGPFKFINTLKGLLIYDLDIDYIYSLFNTIISVEADELQALAKKYLQPDSMIEVIIG